MTDRKIMNVVYDAIDALNEQLDVGQRLEKRPDTVLLGKGGKLDSLGFINLVVLVEDKCQNECGVSVSVTDGYETTDAHPFETVDSLINHLAQLVETKTS